MKDKLMGYLSGLIFAIGLGLAGMIQPQKIIGFLNLRGSWDPSLLFVMGAAVLVSALSYLIVRKLNTPLLAKEWCIPLNKSIDKKLTLGSLLFGVGWGLAGFCPAPAFVSLVTLNTSSILFVTFMLIGMLIFYFYEKRKL